MFSVVILTLNEARALPACLASLAACDDIVVLDSGSTDATADLALRAGARVFTHPFVDFAAQRNYAHEQIPFKYSWVLHLDADERLTPELERECLDWAQRDPCDLDGFWVAPRMMFRGRWIRRCTDFPAYQARLVHVQRFRFVRAGHGQREAPHLRLARLNASYLHDLSLESEAELSAKHRRYAEREAEEFLARNRVTSPSWRDAFASDALRRRRALKHFSYFLPARGMLRFLYQYMWRGGWREGTAGWAYCRILARYETDIAAALRRRRA